MADVNHLKDMVQNFRVAELQVFLGYANLNQTGRKSDLLTRALTVIDSNLPPLLMDKIQHLYQWRYTQHSASRRNYFESETQEMSPASVPLERSISLYSPVVTTHLEEFPSSPVVMEHLEPLPVENNVVLESLPFYSIISEIMRPSYLAPRCYSGYQSAAFSFSLSNEQIHKISSLSSSNGRIPERSNTRVHLRLCAFDKSVAEQTDCWPSSLYLKVNNSLISLPVTGSGTRKCALPIDITPFCHLLSSCVNKIIVSWMSSSGQSYYVAVHEVSKVDSSDLLPLLNNILSPEITKARINENLAADNDGEIAAVGLQLSFRCPLGKMQMRIPCRGATCEHLQCFDGWCYILMNEKKPTWICPICDQLAKLNSLVVDGYFLDILSTEPQVEEVEFRPDGQMIVQNMDDDDLYMGSPSPPPPQSVASKSGGSGSMSFPLVDLTSSDDETGSQLNNSSGARSDAFAPSHPTCSMPLNDRSISPSYCLLTPISNPPGSPQPLHQVVAVPYRQLIDPFQNCSTVPFQHSISCQPDIPSYPSGITAPNDFQQFENWDSSGVEQSSIPDPLDLLGLTNDATVPSSSDYDNFLPLSPMWSAADFDFDEIFSDLPTL